MQAFVAVAMDRTSKTIATQYLKESNMSGAVVATIVTEALLLKQRVKCLESESARQKVVEDATPSLPATWLTDLDLIDRLTIAPGHHLYLGLTRSVVADIIDCATLYRLASSLEKVLSEVFTDLVRLPWFDWDDFSCHGYWIGCNWSAFLRLIRWAFSAVNWEAVYTPPAKDVAQWSSQECKAFFRAHKDFDLTLPREDGDDKSRHTKGVKLLRAEIETRRAEAQLKPQLEPTSVLHLTDNLHALAAALNRRALRVPDIEQIRKAKEAFLDAQVRFEKTDPRPDGSRWQRRTNYCQTLLVDVLLRREGTNRDVLKDDFANESCARRIKAKYLGGGNFKKDGRHDRALRSLAEDIAKDTMGFGAREHIDKARSRVLEPFKRYTTASAQEAFAQHAVLSAVAGRFTDSGNLVWGLLLQDSDEWLAFSVVGDEVVGNLTKSFVYLPLELERVPMRAPAVETTLILLPPASEHLRKRAGGHERLYTAHSLEWTQNVPGGGTELQMPEPTGPDVV
mmetsp:Transcript_3495/g.10817  ORF Transcript_3495/g.10817 Transcript_3495/m.10817 type:complete len:510 (+) Transcript_3495:1305-2834(+)